MEHQNKLSDKFESLLLSYFKSYEPDQVYIDRTRTDLLAAATKITTISTEFSHNRVLSNWRYATALTIFLIIVAVTVIGPAQVWAQLESWIAYLPGLGKVELSGTRVLEEPVFHSEAGITFQVEEFVASPDETFLSIHVTGLPIDEFPSDRDQVYIQWDGPDGQRKGVAIRKSQSFPTYPPCHSGYCPSMQPDGLRLEMEYGPLPLDVDKVQVQWLTYGIVPGAAPAEFWTLDISLVQISDENAQDLLQPGYSPPSAEDSQHGITITVDNVFSGTSGTIIDASVLVPDSAIAPSSQGVFLSTDTGYLSEAKYLWNDMDIVGRPNYKVTPAVPRATTIRVWPERWQFAPIDLQASRMTLEIESVLLTYDTTLYYFDIEVGQDPEVGMTISLDVNFDVEGFPLHIGQARIVMAPAAIEGEIKDAKSIEFIADNTLSADGKRLMMIVFCPYNRPVLSGEIVECSQWIRLDSNLIKDGKIRVSIDMVEIEQQGPWLINWDVPLRTD